MKIFADVLHRHVPELMSMHCHGQPVESADVDECLVGNTVFQLLAGYVGLSLLPVTVALAFADVLQTVFVKIGAGVSAICAPDVVTLSPSAHLFVVVFAKMSVKHP